MKTIITFFSLKPHLATTGFFGGYGAYLLSLLHLIPTVVGTVGVVCGGIAGIIYLFNQIYQAGGIKGVIKEIKWLRNGKNTKK